jgi:FtsZ-binding cell division protein ZapB
MSDEDFEAAGFTEADLEQLREYQAGLIETAQAIQDKKDAVEDSLEELYDGWNERIESQIAKIEHASAVLENYRNIVDTVGKGTFGFDTQTMLKLTRKQIEAANANTRALKD